MRDSRLFLLSNLLFLRAVNAWGILKRPSYSMRSGAEKMRQEPNTVGLLETEQEGAVSA